VILTGGSQRDATSGTVYACCSTVLVDVKRQPKSTISDIDPGIPIYNLAALFRGRCLSSGDLHNKQLVTTRTEPRRTHRLAVSRCVVGNAAGLTTGHAGLPTPRRMPSCPTFLNGETIKRPMCRIETGRGNRHPRRAEARRQGRSHAPQTNLPGFVAVRGPLAPRCLSLLTGIKGPGGAN